jgi:pimeloyl-ACP methyl ester carboxylesterase
MDRIRRDGLDLCYTVLGAGPDVVLLHPFPSCHELWLPVAERLASKYRVILPDLRAHGRSGVPDRPALMADYADDLDALCRELKVGKAVWAGISIGGYILFEMWRRHPQRIRALAILCSKAPADTPEGKAVRLKSADDVLERGVSFFLDAQLPKLLGQTTQRSRRDIVDAARKTMRFATPQAIAMVQRGMAERPDSVPTLRSVSVPTQLIGGEEDTLAPRAEFERMRAEIRGSSMAIVPKAGHYVCFEQPEETFRILRTFCDRYRQ